MNINVNSIGDKLQTMNGYAELRFIWNDVIGEISNG